MKLIWMGVLLFGIIACQPKEDFNLNIPEGIEPFLIPSENPLTAEKVELGRRLFYEKGLSLDSSVSCASCHIQEFAFADTARVSRGFQSDTGFRNSSSLTNVGFQSGFFRDGGVNSLERAVHPPVLTEFEMNMNLLEMLNRLNANEEYRKLFSAAFQSEIDHKGIVYALASFQRTINSFNSPYDAFLAGDETVLSKSQKRGLELFRSNKLNCTACHKEPLFIDDEMHNIGLAIDYDDFGRGRVTLDESDFGKFRTPTLRNIAVTYPYMHNGSLQTLAEVIDFYATGGETHPNRSEKMVTFSISEQEKQDLIHFLESLTDTAFLRDPALANPY